MALLEPSIQIDLAGQMPPDQERNLLLIQNELLEHIARGAPLPETMTQLATHIETLYPELLVSILLLSEDKHTLHHCAGPSLPAAYISVIDGAEIGPNHGSCGTAAHLGKKVITTDIDTDPLWENYRSVALLNGFKACWSTPIVAEGGEVLGTFAGYYHTPASPTPPQLLVFDLATQIARIAILQQRQLQEIRLLANTLDHTPLPMLLLDSDARVVHANHTYCKRAGVSCAQIKGSDSHKFLREPWSEELWRDIWQQLTAGKTWQGELHLPSLTDDAVYYHAQWHILEDLYDAPTHYLLILRDLSEEKRAAAQLQRLSNYDQLTGLPNRSLLIERLGTQLERSRREQSQSALLFIDLDHFQMVNDAHGHPVGDLMLKYLAIQLLPVLGPNDTLARFGGDEFIALLPDLASTESAAATQALAIAERLQAAIRAPVVISGNRFQISASVGITLFPKALETITDLLREGDTAMFQAKTEGRDSVVWFNQAMQARITESYQLEHELRDALANQQFEVWFQPQTQSDGLIIAAEALIRWRHPVRGLVPPLSFIPMAEKSGLIQDIGAWIMKQVFAYSARLENAGSRMRLAVNLSPKQFFHPDFVERVVQAITETGADPQHLVLELTENLLIEDADLVAAKMHTLADLGFHFSIDDFGTGYSSLRYLRRLPLRELKIDKGFVDDLPDNVNGVALVRTILSLAQNLGLSVVAEGVETIEQVEFLNANHCQLLQGYYFSRPKPAHECMEHWLTNKPIYLPTSD